MFIVVIVAVKCLRIVIDYMKDINFIIIAMNLENNMVKVKVHLSLIDILGIQYL